MIVSIFWEDGVCDLCRKDYENRNGLIWLNSILPTREKLIEAKNNYMEWMKKSVCQCIKIEMSEEDGFICEKHFFELMKKGE